MTASLTLALVAAPAFSHPVKPDKEGNCPEGWVLVESVGLCGLPIPPSPPSVCAWIDWLEHESKKETNSLRCPAGTMMTELDLRIIRVHGTSYIVGQALCCISLVDSSAPRVGTIEELFEQLERQRSAR